MKERSFAVQRTRAWVIPVYDVHETSFLVAVDNDLLTKTFKDRASAQRLADQFNQSAASDEKRHGSEKTPAHR